MNLKNLIGMEEERAIKLIVALGATYRIVCRDGFNIEAVTMDMNPNRINLEIRKGIVVKAKAY